ncbi:5'-3' exonuclease [Candidatus Parcubacteria bacterium]|nr:5'-3' exonuclease [Patescibacteria group bacterium]MCG2693847.1 5'-3' exonuclease [Candidatus Parcubacteria bacterium]
MTKLLLVDGHNLLFRMFFGLPARILGKGGFSIHGTIGFIGTLLKTLTAITPTHLLVVFDSERGSFRDEVMADYKATRTKDFSKLPPEGNPFSQLPSIHAALDRLGFRHCEVTGVEADDVIARYARHEEPDEVIIVSTDMDLFQLVGERTRIFCPRGTKSILYGPAEVRARYGIPPALVPDYKALVGDKTDNIAGIPGIGPKTAVRLLAEFGCIANILGKVHAIKPDALQKKLIDYRMRIKGNLDLIRLDCEIHMPFAIDDLRITPESWQQKTMAILRAVGVA